MNKCVMKAVWLSQKSCMMLSTSAMWQTLWVVIQEMSVFVSYWKITYSWHIVHGIFISFYTIRLSVILTAIIVCQSCKFACIYTYLFFLIPSLYHFLSWKTSMLIIVMHSYCAYNSRLSNKLVTNNSARRHDYIWI